jgi:hypothetical protein
MVRCKTPPFLEEALLFLDLRRHLFAPPKKDAKNALQEKERKKGFGNWVHVG